MKCFDVGLYEEDIQLWRNNKHRYNCIYAGTIAWYVVRVLQVLVLFAAMVLPYFVAIVLASVLGF